MIRGRGLLYSEDGVQFPADRAEPQKPLATRVMANGVEVIVAGDSQPGSGGGRSKLLRGLPSRPLALTPTTLQEDIRMTVPAHQQKKPIPNPPRESLLSSSTSTSTVQHIAPATARLRHNYVIKTCFTTFTYLTTLIHKSRTVVSTYESVVSTVTTEAIPTALLQPTQTKLPSAEIFQSTVTTPNLVAVQPKIEKRNDDIQSLPEDDVLQPSEVTPTGTSCSMASCPCTVTLTESLADRQKTKLVNEVSDDSEIVPLQLKRSPPKPTKYGSTIMDIAPTSMSDYKKDTVKNTKYGTHKFDPDKNGSAPSDKVIQKYTEIVNDTPNSDIKKTDSKIKKNEKDSDKNINKRNTTEANPDKRRPQNNLDKESQKPQKTKFQVADLLKLGTLGIKRLAPMIEQMTDNLKRRQEELNKQTTTTIKPVSELTPYIVNKRVDSIEAEHDHKSNTFPIYIPVDDDIETAESQNSFTNSSVRRNIAWVSQNLKNSRTNLGFTKPVHESPLLNGGIPISPGEIITANSDVIVGKPAVGGPNIGHLGNKQNIHENIGHNHDSHSQPSQFQDVKARPPQRGQGLKQIPFIRGDDSYDLRPPMISSAPRPFATDNHHLPPGVGHFDQNNNNNNRPRPHANNHANNQIDIVKSESISWVDNRQPPQPFVKPVNEQNKPHNTLVDHVGGTIHSPVNLLENHGRPAFLDYIPSLGTPTSYQNYIKNNLITRKNHDDRVAQQNNLDKNKSTPSKVLTTSDNKHIPTFAQNQNGFVKDPPEPILLTDLVQKTTVKPFLVDIQPSRVANVLIPHGSTTALIFAGSSEPHKNGEYIDDPLPYQEPGYFGSFSIDAPHMTSVHVGGTVPLHQSPTVLNQQGKPFVKNTNNQHRIPLAHNQNNDQKIVHNGGNVAHGSSPDPSVVNHGISGLNQDVKPPLGQRWKYEDTTHGKRPNEHVRGQELHGQKIPPPISSQESNIHFGPHHLMQNPKFNFGHDVNIAHPPGGNKFFSESTNKPIKNDFTADLAVPPPPPPTVQVKYESNVGVVLSDFDKFKNGNQNTPQQFTNNAPPKITSEVYFASTASQGAFGQKLKHFNVNIQPAPNVEYKPDHHRPQAKPEFINTFNGGLVTLNAGTTVNIPNVADSTIPTRNQNINLHSSGTNSNQFSIPQGGGLITLNAGTSVKGTHFPEQTISGTSVNVPLSHQEVINQNFHSHNSILHGQHINAHNIKEFHSHEGESTGIPIGTNFAIKVEPQMNPGYGDVRVGVPGVPAADFRPQEKGPEIIVGGNSWKAGPGSDRDDDFIDQIRISGGIPDSLQNGNEKVHVVHASTMKNYSVSKPLVNAVTQVFSQQTNKLTDSTQKKNVTEKVKSEGQAFVGQNIKFGIQDSQFAHSSHNHTFKQKPHVKDNKVKDTQSVLNQHNGSPNRGTFQNINTNAQQLSTLNRDPPKEHINKPKPFSSETTTTRIIPLRFDFESDRFNEFNKNGGFGQRVPSAGLPPTHYNRPLARPVLLPKEKPTQQQRPFNEQRPVNEQRPFNEQKPINEHRPHPEPRPFNEHRPHPEPRPFSEQRPFNEQRPIKEQRPINVPRPFNDRPFNEQRPVNDLPEFMAPPPLTTQAYNPAYILANYNNNRQPVYDIPTRDETPYTTPKPTSKPKPSTTKQAPSGFISHNVYKTIDEHDRRKESLKDIAKLPVLTSTPSTHANEVSAGFKPLRNATTQRDEILVSSENDYSHYTTEEKRPTFNADDNVGSQTEQPFNENKYKEISLVTLPGLRQTTPYVPTFNQEAPRPFISEPALKNTNTEPIIKTTQGQLIPRPFQRLPNKTDNDNLVLNIGEMPGRPFTPAIVFPETQPIVTTQSSTSMRPLLSVKNNSITVSKKETDKIITSTVNLVTNKPFRVVNVTINKIPTTLPPFAIDIPTKLNNYSSMMIDNMSPPQPTAGDNFRPTANDETIMGMSPPPRTPAPKIKNYTKHNEISTYRPSYNVYKNQYKRPGDHYRITSRPFTRYTTPSTLGPLRQKVTPGTTITRIMYPSRSSLPVWENPGRIKTKTTVRHTLKPVTSISTTNTVINVKPMSTVSPDIMHPEIYPEENIGFGMDVSSQLGASIIPDKISIPGIYPTVVHENRPDVAPSIISAPSVVQPHRVPSIQSSENVFKENVIQETESLKVIPTIGFSDDSRKPTKTLVHKFTVPSVQTASESIDDKLTVKPIHHAGNEIKQSDDAPVYKAPEKTLAAVTYTTTLAEPASTVMTTRYVTLTHTLTVTQTKTSLVSPVIGSTTQTLVLTNTQTSTVVDVVTEIHTLVQPTTIVQTITEHVPLATLPSWETKYPKVPIEPTKVRERPYMTREREVIKLDDVSLSSDEDDLIITPDNSTVDVIIGNNNTSTQDSDTFFVVMNKSQNGGSGTSNVNPPLDGSDFDGATRNEEVGNDGVSHVLLGEILLAGTPYLETPQVVPTGVGYGKECQPDCKASRNERCQRLHGLMKCVCRPGFARMFPDRPCKPTYTYSLKLALSKRGGAQLKYDAELSDRTSPAYRDLASAAHAGLDRMVMQSDLRDVYHGVHVDGFAPVSLKTDKEGTYDAVLNQFYVQLSDNAHETRLKEVMEKYLRNNNFSLGGTDVYAAAELVDKLEVGDFNECMSSQFHDCSEHAECFNLRATYTCSCREGFADLSVNPQYPGRICSAEPIGCERCNYHGTCYNRDDAKVLCECFQWYAGESCHINLKVILISLSTIGALLIVLLLFCVVVTCARRRRGRENHPRHHHSAIINSCLPPMHQGGIPTSKMHSTLDKRALIQERGNDSGGEGSSVHNLSLPYIPAKKVSQVSHKSGKKLSLTDAAQPTREKKPFTLMIPRAKYCPAPNTSPLVTAVECRDTNSGGKRKSSGESSNEAKLLTYLDAGPTGNDHTRRKQSNESSYSNRAIPQKYSTGALVSAGFKVSTTVSGGMAASNNPGDNDSCHKDPMIHHHQRDDDDESSITKSNTLHTHNQSQFDSLRKAYSHEDLNDWTDAERRIGELTMSEARSFDGTLVKPSTKMMRSTTGSNKSSAHYTQHEANTMAERDLGSTFLLPHVHLYKPEMGSDVSEFDSL